MGADLNNIVKCQKLTDDHVQFLIYQILRGLKVSGALKLHSDHNHLMVNVYLKNSPFFVNSVMKLPIFPSTSMRTKIKLEIAEQLFC